MTLGMDRPVRTEVRLRIPAWCKDYALSFIPYFAWDNRAAGKMKVWIPLGEGCE